MGALDFAADPGDAGEDLAFAAQADHVEAGDGIVWVGGHWL